MTRVKPADDHPFRKPGRLEAGATLAIREAVRKNRLGLSVQDLEALALEYKIMRGEDFEISDNDGVTATLSYEPDYRADHWRVEIEHDGEAEATYDHTSFGAALCCILDSLDLGV